MVQTAACITVRLFKTRHFNSQKSETYHISCCFWYISSGQISSRPHEPIDFPQHVAVWKGNHRLFQANLGWLNIIHPQKLTWNLEMMVSNRNLLFQGAPIFRFHVCFGGCNLARFLQTNWVKALVRYKLSSMPMHFNFLDADEIAESRGARGRNFVVKPNCDWMGGNSEIGRFSFNLYNN